ncbi:MAG: heavy metal translocating P-type ATPase metal-binding domain-containing protein [Bacteroidota bacterium]|nr:heavy metal translocating P-type ATPase metal-binding domain-containing protein [Bacteroidota bacterium]
METVAENIVSCSHCGLGCPPDPVRLGEQAFCCEGCSMVFQLLDHSGLCTYYRLNDHPGINRRIGVRKDKFAFLDDPKVAAGLIAFQNDTETHVQFYAPQIHCSSCLYLLEQLHRLDPGIISSRVDFAAKQVRLIFDPRRTSLRAAAELLTSIGYEPHISLRDWDAPRSKPSSGLLFQLGIAGFCFANSMLISFPEYLGLDLSEPSIQRVFRYLNFLVSLPVVLYCARPFYASAWKGLRHRFLNIDAPIVLAIGVTFVRSVWEVFSGQGSGYFDSMSGIVFLMLAGRVLQDRTYRNLSFDRDYRSYFPVAVTVLVRNETTGEDGETIKTMADIRTGDTLRIYSGELIPADGILTRGKALIDYSFVTGESLPVDKQMGELLYAGGRQTGAAIEMLVVREVAQSYLTQLWNRKDKNDRTSKTEGDFSFVHPLSRYFTYIVLAVAAAAAFYWSTHDPARVWNSVTAVLIVACPCALFLSSTFTNGNLLRILGRNHFYLRNAETIERVAVSNHIVFDKTGTLTEAGRQELFYTGDELTPKQQASVAILAAQSHHPLSKTLSRHLNAGRSPEVQHFQEIPGKGVEGIISHERIALGSLAFLTGESKDKGKGTRIYVAIDRKLLGFYSTSNRYREGLPDLACKVKKYATLSVLSGDNAREEDQVQELLGRDTVLLFDQTPVGKSRYIQHLQRIGKKVMMIGDGLNDAGALQQSDIGIALTEDSNNFTPASDAILRADGLGRLPDFIRLCRAGKRIILASFILSIVYNLVGLAFAVSGALSPLVAAILMPSSSLTILLVTYGSSNGVARWLRL